MNKKPFAISHLEGLMTTKEAAELLRITTITLHKLTHNGKIPGYKIGGRVLYKKKELINCLEPITKPQK